MRYFKRVHNGNVIAFGCGGTDGVEISQKEFEQIQAEYIAQMQEEIISRPDPEPFEEKNVTYEDRLQALEAAVLEMALEG